MNTSDENSALPPSDQPPSDPQPSFKEGQKLAGVFVLRREMPSASGERIWLAHDEILGKDVSLHFIPDSLRQDERALSELRAEIKRNRQLIHRGILRVYDLIEEPEWVAISMDWFEGESLASRLQKKGSPFSTSEIEPWVRQVCATLEDIHKIQVVHRNLSPANLFVDGTGRLLVAKFGVSRVIEDALGRLRDRTQGPEPHIAYLSPQQLDGETANRLDDIYALGAACFELLAGQPVFNGPDAFTQVRRTPAPAVGHGAPAAWEKTIAACLAKNPAERPATAGAVAQQLELGAARPAGETPSTPVGTLPATAAIAAPVAAAAAAESQSPSAAATPLPTPAEKGTPSETEPDGETSNLPPPAEAARGKRKIVAPPPKDPETEKDATDSGVEEIYPDLYPKRSGGSSATLVAIVVVVLGIIGGVIYFNRSHKTEEGQPAPVNNAMAQVATPKPAPPSTPATAAASHAASTPPAEPSDLTAGLLPDEPKLVDVQPTVPGSTAPLKNVAENSRPAADNHPRSTPAVPALHTPQNSVAAGGSPPATPTVKMNPAPEAALPVAAGNLPVVDLATGQANLDKAREGIAAAEKAYQDALKKQQSAETALAAAQKGVTDKAGSISKSQKATDDLQAERQKREEAAKAAADAARDARQAAEEQMRAADQKARVAEDTKKAFTDWEVLNREKLSSRDKLNAELDALKNAATEKQHEVDEATRVAAEADAGRQKQAAAAKQAADQVAMARLAAEQEKKAEAEKARLAAKADADREMAELKRRMDELLKKQRDLERGESAEPAPATATPAPRTVPTPAPRAATPAPATPAPATPALATPARATPIVATPAPATPARATPAAATPAAATPVAVVAPPPGTPAPVAMATPAPVVAPPPASTPSAAGSDPHPVSASNDKVTFENSLGIKFAPVADVLFAIWPVRIQDYEVFAQEANVRSNLWRTPGFKQGPTHPVVNVSWIDAMAFCKWLTDREHKKNVLPKDQLYRLPTDLEWSRAVGLGEESGKTPSDRDMGVPDVFPWGTQWPPPPNVGNYTGEETGSDVAIKGYDDGFAWTSPVGSFPANKYGLYDMGGNVWQWCMDLWEQNSKARVLRGASWYNGALKLSLLSSCRLHSNTDSSTDNYGFRIVRASEAGSKHIR